MTEIETIELCRQALSKEAYWQVNKRLAKTLGIKTAIILADLISKEYYFRIKEQLKDGFFFNTQENIQKDTSFTPHEQRQALLKLESNRIITTKRIGTPPKKYFKIHHSQILKILTFKDKENLQTLITIKG